MSNVGKERVAFETIKNITLEHADVINLRKEFDFTLSILSTALDELDQLRERHRPSTFDEVVKAWEETIDDEVNIAENDEGVRVVYPNGIYYLVNLGQVYSNRKVFNMNVNVTLKAINLTIRYLEAQKEKAND